MSQNNNKQWTLVAVCVATFMLLIDVTIVNVALKSIQDDLHSTFSDLQWVVDAYALTLASFLLTFGSLSDIFGRRRIFLFGIGLFTLASLSCALSTTPMMLNISRAVQGVGGAAMFATALALLGQEFQGKDRGTAFGIWGAVTGAAVAVGPLVGGALVDGFGWQSIFLVNIPVGLIAIAMTLAKVRDLYEPRKVKVDYIGFATFSLALFALIYALVRGNGEGWSSTPIVSCLVAAAVLFVAFVTAEIRQDHRMLDLALFRKPTFIGASVAAFALSASIFSLFLYVTLYFQNVLGYSPFETGLRFLPTTLLSFVVAAFAGKASSHFSPKLFMGIGLGLVAIGLAVISLLVNDKSDWTAAIVGLCIAGFGIGLTNPPLASTAIGVVEPRQAGMASGINSTFRQIGIATGIAGLGAIFSHSVASGVVSRMNGVGNLGSGEIQSLADGVTNGKAGQIIAGLPQETQGAAAAAVHSSFVHSFNIISIVAACVALVGSAVVFVSVRTQDFASGGHGPRTETAPAAES